jgi:phosphatidylglycerol:prolipoprotein diacylglycerol transferase
MLKFPAINPTIFKIGMFEIRWYGLFYIVGFVLAYIFVKKNFAYKKLILKKEEYESLLFNMMLGVIIGARFGYVLFYNLSYYLHHPLEIFVVWHGGMSFHGGAIGVIIFGYLFCRKYKYKFFELADPVVPLVSIGLFFGRIGNFINAELYGKITNQPWGMVFPNSDGNPRHPSQLYEAFLEGLLLFVISYIVFRKVKKTGITFWSWVGFYGLFRFLVEFVREPDAHLGYIFWFMTMGQILSAIMVLASLIAIFLIARKKSDEAQES